MTIQRRIVILGAGVAISLGTVLGLYTAKLGSDSADRRAAELERLLREDFDRSARLQVDSAVSLLRAVADQAARDGVPLEEAKRRAAPLLRDLRYGKDGRFFAIEFGGTTVVQQGSPMEGKPSLDLTDARGKHFVREFLERGRSGGGYTDYHWIRAQGGPQLPKRGYTLAFEPFGWVVGTGNYTDDIDAAVSQERARAHEDAVRQLTILALGVLVACAAAAAVAAGLARAVVRPLRRLVGETARLREAVAEGRLDVRADRVAIAPEFYPLVDGIDEIMDAYARPIEVTAAYVSRIAAGDLPAPITDEYRGDFNRIKEALNGCIAAISGLVGDLGSMTAAQLAGDLDAAIEVDRFTGAFRSVADGVNENTRMHVRNVLEALEILRRYGEGDFSAEMRRLPGKQVVLTEKVNAMRTNLMAVAGEVRMLGQALARGDLSTRADENRFHGEWRETVRRVNEAVEAGVGPFRIIGDYMVRISHGEIPERRTRHVEGELQAVQQGVNRCLDSLERLVGDADALAKAAVAGALSTRADLSRHEGAFRSALEGVNRTLDAVMAPVNDAAQVLDRLARRDLRARVTATYGGDHARIAASVNATAEALHGAMTQVASAVEQVSSAAAQIATSSQAVAAGASEQAAALTETTGSVETVSGMTRQSADHAQSADQLAVSARDAAAAGVTAAEGMQQAIARIRASAEGTSQIIRDINDIAFQTNLLALNAAVEAARAGDAGRGFAVVAEEVRTLALRAKDAAAKTEERIRQSVKEAGEGEASAQRVAADLGRIAAGIGKVTAVVGEIAGAAKEQAEAIAQVTRGVGEMDKVTQQNAASAEESSSSASELSGQAEELAAMVASFRLEGRAVAGVSPRSAPPKALGTATAGMASANRPSRGGGARADDAFPMEGGAIRDF